MILLYKFIVLAGMLVGMFLLGRKSRDRAFLSGYALGRKCAMWRAQQGAWQISRRTPQRMRAD